MEYPIDARKAPSANRPPLPSLNQEAAILKVRKAEGTWYSRDPIAISMAYSAECALDININAQLIEFE